METPDAPRARRRFWRGPRHDRSEDEHGGAVAPQVAGRLAVVVSAGLALALGFLGQRQFVDERDEQAGLLLWGIAIAVFLAALWWARARNEHRGAAHALPPGPLPVRNEFLLLAGVLCVGVFFRFFRIGSVPPGLNNDAAWNGLYALKVTPVVDYFREPYVVAAWGRETMFHQIIAAFQTFLGPSEFAIELAAITVGIATLVAFYLMMRRLFDTEVALVATFLLGVSGWHITMSRVGWRAILVPFFAAGLSYLLVRAVQERRLRDFAIVGAVLGLSIDTYDAARILPLFVIVYLAYEAFRDRSLVTAHWRHVGVLGLAAVAASAPLGLFALDDWEGFTGRGNFLWIGTQIERAGSWEPLFTNLKNAALLFNFRGNGDDFFVAEPLLDVPVSVFFVLGLILALTRLRERAHFLIVTMLILMLAVGVASEPNGNRGIGTVIPATALAALFLVEAWRWLRTAYPRYELWFSYSLVVILLLTGYATYESYLGPDRREQWGFPEEATQVGNYMGEIPPEYEIHVAAQNWPRDTLAYLSYHEERDPLRPPYVYSTDATTFLHVEPDAKSGTAFIAQAGRTNEDIFATLRAKFPSAHVDSIEYPEGSGRAIAHVLLLAPFDDRPGDGPPVTAADAPQRDATRRDDLQQIATALDIYHDQVGAFPIANEPARVCADEVRGPLCQLDPLLPEGALIDPLGSGYWYESDGASFTLYAALESPPAPDERCGAAPPALAEEPNLLCVQGD